MRNFANISDFEPPDSDQTARKLKLKSVAKERGEQNLPASDAREYDGFERKLIGLFQSDCNAVKQDIISIIQATDDDISSQKTRLLDEGHISEAKIKLTELQQGFESFKRQYKEERVKHLEAKAHYDQFRESRFLKNQPTERKPLGWYLVDLYVLIVIEALINMYFFSHGNSMGFLGGLMEAFGVAAFNVAIWFVIGWWGLKRINSVQALNKTFGYALLMLSLILIVIMHLLVGMYREIFITSENIDRTAIFSEAIDALLIFDFSLFGPTTIFLVSLGVLMAARAAYKGYDYGHTYPGYSTQYEKYKASSDWVSEYEDELRENYIETVSNIRNSLGHQIQAFEPRFRDLDSLRTRRAAVLDRWSTYVTDTTQTLKALISLYRDTNRSFRSEPEPKYFDRSWPGEQDLLGSNFVAFPDEASGLESELRERTNTIRANSETVLCDLQFFETKLNTLLEH